MQKLNEHSNTPFYTKAQMQCKLFDVIKYDPQITRSLPWNFLEVA